MKPFKNLLKRLFCKHNYVTRFRGQFTKGVECTSCGNSKLLERYNNKREPMGWIEDLDNL